MPLKLSQKLPVGISLWRHSCCLKCPSISAWSPSHEELTRTRVSDWVRSGAVEAFLLGSLHSSGSKPKGSGWSFGFCNMIRAGPTLHMGLWNQRSSSLEGSLLVLLNPGFNHSTPSPPHKHGTVVRIWIWNVVELHKIQCSMQGKESDFVLVSVPPSYLHCLPRETAFWEHPSWAWQQLPIS